MRCPWGAAAVGAVRSPQVKNVLISVLGLPQSPPQPPLPGQKNLSFPCFLRNTTCVQTKRLCNSVLKHSLSVREEGGGDL